MTQPLTWESLARSMVQSRLDAERFRDEAAQRGDRREARQWEALIRKVDRDLAKYQITIRYS